MADIYPYTYMNGGIVPLAEAKLSVASSAVLYGLSVYTVFPVFPDSSQLAAFRLSDHYQRLVNSARIIGIADVATQLPYQDFVAAASELVHANKLTGWAFVRATVHVTAALSGTRSRGLETTVSMFAYSADSILPLEGARLKTSVWRRVPDYAIPSRAKVNGAYVNSVLGKQDAIDSGYDDCLFLDVSGHVCELSAANIFIVRNGVLITPGQSADILEGINRRTIIELATELNIPVEERMVDLTELYVADEVFACGTSVYLTPVIEIDARMVNDGSVGDITNRLQTAYRQLFSKDHTYATVLV